MSRLCILANAVCLDSFSICAHGTKYSYYAQVVHLYVEKKVKTEHGHSTNNELGKKELHVDKKMN
jgi:hypothetical protein